MFTHSLTHSLYLLTHSLTYLLTYLLTAFLGTGGCLVGVGFVGCEHRTLAVVLLTVGVAFEGLCYSGLVVNHIDFAPRSVLHPRLVLQDNTTLLLYYKTIQLYC